MQDAQDRAAETVTIDVFDSLDIRAGRIISVDPFPEARKPSYKLRIDFGPLGSRQSSAQLTAHYTPEQLVGRMVVAVVNFPPRRIAGFASEVLVLGLPDRGIAREGGVVLIVPEQEVEPGARVF
ncbi:MAG: tRNA-binding protein [Chloroflexia bacterium]|jgi:tRNA-binding protein|nr:tRNA-binding protein [Chloroflexia bacterium]